MKGPYYVLDYRSGRLLFLNMSKTEKRDEIVLYTYLTFKETRNRKVIPLKINAETD